LCIIYLIIAILIFDLLIACHEFGHFFAAKLCGVKVNEFAIGMGPTLLKKQKGETLYSLRAFPIGGYCTMEGENEDTGDDRALTVQPAWKKLVILAAGSFMNFVIGVIFLAAVTFPATGIRTNEITGLEQNFPNHPEQFFQIGDRIVEVDGHVVFRPSDISLLVSRSGGTVDLVVERGGERLELLNYALTAVEQEDGSKRPALGVFLNGVEEATLGIKLRHTWLQVVDSVRLTWSFLGELFRGDVDLLDMPGLAGVAPVVSKSNELARQLAVRIGLPTWYGTLMGILCCASAFSMGIAVTNLLPIPALDGGRIFFVFINGIFTALTKKRLDPKYEDCINGIGLNLLLTLTLVLTLNDVLNLIL